MDNEEGLGGPITMHRSEIEMSAVSGQVYPPWMKKETLEKWLRRHYGDVTVEECEARAATAKGDNYVSNMQRLVVRTKNGDSYSLVVKCKLEETTVGRVMKHSTIYMKEQEMYSNTLPGMFALLQKAFPGKVKQFGPLSFYTCDSFLVLEDLTAVGFRMLNRREGLNLEQSLLVIRTLARFHATSVILHQHDPQCMEKYDASFHGEPCTFDAWHKCFSGLTKTLADELETWPEEWSPYVKKLRCLQENILERIKRTVQRRDSDFNVLIHGDLWTNNMMFRDDTDVRFFDYQLVHFTSPAIDLHYFIVTSTQYDVRVNHTKKLLQEHHTTLCDTLTTLKYNKTPITLEELHEEFKKKSMFGLYALVAPAGVMTSDPAAGFNMDASLEDGSNPGPSLYSDLYKKIVKWTLPILNDMGAFNEV